MVRRLRIYFTGFGIGLIIVYVMFLRDDSRDLDIWTPSQRILEEVRGDSLFQISERLQCYQACLSLSDSSMAQLWTESEVKSLNPGGDPYKYAIALKEGDMHIEAELEKTTSYKLIYIKDHNSPQACACD